MTTPAWVGLFIAQQLWIFEQLIQDVWLISVWILDLSSTSESTFTLYAACLESADQDRLFSPCQNECESKSIQMNVTTITLLFHSNTIILLQF